MKINKNQTNKIKNVTVSDRASLSSHIVCHSDTCAKSPKWKGWTVCVQGDAFHCVRGRLIAKANIQLLAHSRL